LAFTADGARLIAGSAFGPVRAWDLTTGQEVVKPPWPEETGPVLAFARDGKSLIQSPGKLIDLTTGQARPLVDQDQRATAAAISPDGRTAAVGKAGQPSKVQLWDLTTEKELPALEVGATPIRELAFAPDSRSLLVVLEGKLKLFDWAGRKELSGGEAAVIAMALVPAEPHPGLFYYLAVSTGRRVTLWRIDGPRLQQVLQMRDFPDAVRALAWTRSGQIMAAGTGRGHVILWDVTTNKEPQSWQLPGAVHGLAISPDGKTVAAGTGNGTVYLFRRRPR
jgi:WD40 repeat protein